jgi:hypothetical protein
VIGCGGHFKFDDSAVRVQIIKFQPTWRLNITFQTAPKCTCIRSLPAVR